MTEHDDPRWAADANMYARDLMRRGLLATAVLLVFLPILASAAAAVIRLSEPVESTADFETFGEPLDEAEPVIELEQLLQESDRHLGRSVIVKTRVARVCQKKGCFFIAQQGAATARVSFKDYGFFVPTDIGGKQVTLAGELQRRDRSAAEAAHYAADLGDPEAVVPSGPVYEIVATSVRIPR